MQHFTDVRLVTDDLHMFTDGLAQQGHPEIAVQVAEVGLLPESAAFLQTLARYIQTAQVRLKPAETLAYGYWLTQFQPGPAGRLEVWEYQADARAFVPGATLTLRYWRDQHALCQRLQATFTPPRHSQLAAISAGVLEGEPVEGVRYPSPAHMSGWWLTTDRYDGNIASLTTQHLHHVTAARPDLAQYLALPYGYRFAIQDREYVWFDRKVAAEPPM